MLQPSPLEDLWDTREKVESSIKENYLPHDEVVR